MIEALATIAVAVPATVAGTAWVMRRKLATDRAELVAVAAEQDHRDELQDVRYYELADWSNDLAVEEDRLAQWDAFFRAQFGTEPDTIGSTVEEEDVEVPVNRARFSYQPEVVRSDSDLILFVEGIGEIFDDVLAEPSHGTNLGDERLPVLADARAAIFRRMAQTGQFAIVANPDQPPKPGDTEKPVLIGQPRVDAAVLHAIWNRKPRPVGTDDDTMPVPTTPPTAGTLPTPDQPANPHTPPGPPVPKSGPRPGTNTDTTGQPPRPKPAVAVAA